MLISSLFPLRYIAICAFVTTLVGTSLTAQTTYKQPSKDVVNMVEAPPTPNVTVSPKGDAMILTAYNPYPGIATLARPFLKLAGLRIDPARNSRQRITEFTGATVQWIEGNKQVVVQMPEGGKRLAGVPSWSPDGKQIAFGVDTDSGVELWVSDTKTGKSKRLGSFYINDVLGGPFGWMEDGVRIWVKQIPANRGAFPATPTVPSGPNIEESTGKVSQVMTYQDLLKSASDEAQFEYLAKAQLSIVDSKSGKSELYGTPGLYIGTSWSPNEQYLLTTTLTKPFSYRVQYGNFARSTEIRDRSGKVLRTLVQYPVTDEIPRQGVVDGPRDFEWQALYPAKLLWAVALDGGDPKKKVALRDKVFALEAPFVAEPTVVTSTKHRFSGFEWSADRGIALLSEYDRDRRWIDTWRFDMAQPDRRDTMFSVSVNDDYNAPGNPIYRRLPNGEYVIAQEGDWAYFSHSGASPKGEYPRLDMVNLRTRARKTIFVAAENTFEEFIAFGGDGFKKIITRHQSKTQVPNLFISDITGGNRTTLTTFTDPAPQMTGVNKKLVQYKRKDGVPLSGTLYLPTSYQPGQKLPLFMWAYPLEYSDASTAGQVRGSDNKFTYYRGDSPLFFVTQGYAVLMDATMPVVGDPETMNNTFVEQMTTSGRAAIDYLDSLGIIDRKRVGVGGHSYGAFMTANLLAHSDDYAYGIARSGAYNRTLTPFGFQSERRSFWEAQDIYMNLSPFTHANKINEPLLLIHGEADNNPGTHTIQSERLFQAIKGNGGTARLVLLPHESHGYRAKESIEHVLAEMFEWADKNGTKTKP